ncbi:dTDP-D-glucose 4,6-dehydratase [Sporosarcina luteola]|nr:dTDP-D-glucose 4,6-dehydratase [Sporosarcina luteola]
MLVRSYFKPIGEIKRGIRKYEKLITFVADRPGHDFRYAIDDRKLQTELGFSLHSDFEMRLKLTTQYYLGVK